MPSLILEQRPAFCRFNFPHLVVSTYQLDSDSQSRLGALYLLNPDLSTFQVITTPAGIFRFEIVDQSCISALTNGSLYVVNLSNFDSSIINVSDDMLLNVSVDENQAVATTNKGNINLVDCSSKKVISSWDGHKLPYTSEPCEVWSADIMNSKICTGGEDAFLVTWDSRSSSKIATYKVFNAGVTYAKWKNDHQIITGSYDQYIRILDERNPSKTLVETETDGGVWHIESRGVGNSEQHITACMYGGVAIFDANWKVTYKHMEAGKELLYGVSFMDPSTVAYTTFNDYKVTTEVLKNL